MLRCWAWLKAVRLVAQPAVNSYESGDAKCLQFVAELNLAMEPLHARACLQELARQIDSAASWLMHALQHKVTSWLGKLMSET
jgi:hypothetical protein